MDENPIKLVIASPHRLLREGLRQILQKDATIEVIGETVDGAKTLETVKEMQPSVLLIDISITGTDGFRLISLIRTQCSLTKPLILSGSMDDETVFGALKAGVKGYVSSEANSDQLIKAIQAVHHGELWVQRRMIAKFFDEEAIAFASEHEEEGLQSDLTPREREVLSCLTAGYTNKEIAEKLFISEKTVKTHLNSIFRKLRVTKRLQAILYALDRGIT